MQMFDVATSLLALCVSNGHPIFPRWWPYRSGIPAMFPGVDYGQLVKINRSTQEETRYSPAQIIEARRKSLAGTPDIDRICTSHVERVNLPIRMQLRRFTRLTNGFSKKVRNHEAALALFFAYYNFCRKHETLKMTPAVAAGVAEKRWTMRELMEMAAQ